VRQTRARRVLGRELLEAAVLEGHARAAGIRCEAHLHFGAGALEDPFLGAFEDEAKRRLPERDATDLEGPVTSPTARGERSCGECPRSGRTATTTPSPSSTSAYPMRPASSVKLMRSAKPKAVPSHSTAASGSW
jgi:hypothetical protein